jgi:predicted GNAT superfamily acetyltransferase
LQKQIEIEQTANLQFIAARAGDSELFLQLLDQPAVLEVSNFCSRKHRYTSQVTQHRSRTGLLLQSLFL